MRLAQINFDELMDQLPTPEVGPAGVLTSGDTPTIGSIVSALLPYIFAIAGIAMLLYLLYGGYHLMLSRGDPDGMKEAKAKITNAIIGFVLVFISYWIIQVLSVALGIPGIQGLFGVDTGAMRQNQLLQCRANCDSTVLGAEEKAKGDQEELEQIIVNWAECYETCGKRFGN